MIPNDICPICSHIHCVPRQQMSEHNVWHRCSFKANEVISANTGVILVRQGASVQCNCDYYRMNGLFKMVNPVEP